MNNLQSLLGNTVAENWATWTTAVRAALWANFTMEQKQAIWAEFHDQPELCPEPAPLPQMIEPLKPIAGAQAEALRRFDELVANLPVAQPTVIRPELPRMQPKVVSGYELPPPSPKPQPAPKVKEPGHITTVAELPTEVKVKAVINVIGWILVIWFFFMAFR